MRPIARLQVPEGEAITLPGPPPKTTFGGSRSPEQVRIGQYMQAIAPALIPYRDAVHKPLGMRLEVGLRSTADLLTHNDLDNYLEPLATFIGRGELVGAWASKRHSDNSTLLVGSVVRETRVLTGWEHATASAVGLSERGRRDIGMQIARQAEPVPWGPVELQLALRVSSRERWVRAWKPAIDSLVGILGRRPGKSEFDIEDGRIVDLALHCDTDASLGHDVELEVWWRAVDLSSPDVGTAVVLSYEVGAQASAQPRTPQRRQPRGGRRKPHVGDSSLDALGVTLISDVAQFRDIRAGSTGFVVITDDANLTRLHRAGCDTVKEANFVRKVIENRMKTGEYYAVSDLESARRLWPAVVAHRCI